MRALFVLCLILASCSSVLSRPEIDDISSDLGDQQTLAVSLAWSQPAANANVSGTTVFTLDGANLVNVEIFKDGVMLVRCDVSADGQSATASIDTTQFANSALTITAHAWNSLPGQSFTSEADAGELTINVNNAPSDAQPPPQAVAAGYTHPVMIENFDSQSAVATDGIASWYNRDMDQETCSPGSWDIANGVLTITNAENNYGDSLTTVNSRSAPTSTPGAIATNTGLGMVFKYGYFESKMRWDTTAVRDHDGNGNQLGWPAFWMTSMPDVVPPPMNTMECDFFEDFLAATDFSHLGGGAIKWYGTDSGLYTHFFGSLGAPGLQGPQTPDVIASAGLEPGGWNIFGCLWTPTRIQYYWTSDARRAAGIADTLVFDIATVSPSGGMRDNDGNVSSEVYDGANNYPSYLMLGTGQQGPNVEIDWTHVWQ